MHQHVHTHTQEDPEVIEGDEDEAMIAESNITGETLLTNEYLVVSFKPYGSSQLI